MGFTIRMTMLNNVKYRDAIYLKSGDRFFTSPTITEVRKAEELGLESKASVSSTIKENLLLYCRKFWAFAVALII